MTRKSRGFSLVEIVLALGIFSFVSLAFAHFMAQISRELRASNQKIEMLSLERDLEMAARMNTSLCSAIVAGLTFNASNLNDPSSPRPRIELKDGISISDSSAVAKPGELLPGTTTGLVVDQVYLEMESDLSPGSPEIYTGFFVVQMTGESMIRALQPAKFRYYFLAEDSSPLNARQLISCSPHPVGQGCEPPEFQIGMYSNGDAICSTVAQQMGQGCQPGYYVQGVAPDGSWICEQIPAGGEEPDPGDDDNEEGSCTAPDGTVFQSGQWAHHKWVAFEREVGCHTQSAQCQDGAWTNNVISPQGAPSFELSLSPDQCTPVGHCLKSSDHMVIQVGLSQQDCQNTWYTGGHWQAVRGNYVVHQEGWNVQNTQYLTNTQKSACGISHGTPYCWWED